MTRLDIQRGMSRWNVSQTVASVWSSIVFGTIPTGFLLGLGASNAMVGMLSGANSWGHVSQLVTPLVGARIKRRKPLVLLTYSLGYSVWLLVAAVALLPAGWPRPQLAIASVILGGMLIAVGYPQAQTWLADLVPLDRRGRFISRQQSMMAAVGLVAGLAASYYVDHYTGAGQLRAMQVAFIVAVTAALASQLIWSRVPEPPRSRPAGALSPRLLLLPLRHPNFRNLTFFLAARTGAMMMAAPFFSVYMLTYLKISYATIALYSVVVIVCQIASNPFWGYMADKFGYKPLLRISTFGAALIPIPWFFTTPQNYPLIVLLAQAWAGVMGAGLVLSQYNLMLKTAPEEHREVYIGVHTAVVNLAVGLGSILGGVLADYLQRVLEQPAFLGRPITYLHVIFMVSALLRFLGLSLLLRVREAPEISARTVIGQVRRGNVMRTLYHLGRLRRSDQTSTRVSATRALGSPGNVLAIDELVSSLDDSQLEVRREAARSLGAIADERAVPPLVERASDPIADIAQDATDALGQIGGGQAVAALLALLEDRRSAVRRSAAQALGALEEQAAVPEVARRLETETDPSVMLALTETLARLGSTSALRQVPRLLGSLSGEVARKQLAHAISYLLGDAQRFYHLLELEPLPREEYVARKLDGLRRLLVRAEQALHLPGGLGAARIGLAATAYEREDYAAMLHHLRDAALRLHHQVDARPEVIDQRSGLWQRLRLNLAVLTVLVRASRQHPTSGEEALLAIFAFEQTTLLARRLRRAATGTT